MASVRILVVEDEVIVGEDISCELRVLGYETEPVALTGEEAVERAVAARPDLVLMDINLAGAMDGIEAARQIRAATRIPVVYLTSYSDEETIQRASHTEPYGYILKPFGARDLRIAVEMAIYKCSVERQLRESEQKFRSIIEQSQDGIVLADEQRRIIEWNQAQERLTGLKRAEVIGHSLDELPQQMLYSHGGMLPVVQTVSFPVNVESGTLVGSITRDITELKQAETALRQHVEELEARNNELDAFSHTVAHDLKNPLGIIRGYLEMHLGEPGLDEELARDLTAALDSAQRMERIIEELLRLAYIRQATVELEPLNMAAIIHAARQSVAPLASEMRAEITIPDQWPLALGYGPWIEEVWANYLSNALKYGGRPPRVELGADVLQNGHVRFWVRDNGNGLTVHEQAKLFTPFTRLGQHRAKGNGLGLSIVRRIMEKLGGQVEVESRVGQGSTFAFILPSAAR